MENTILHPYRLLHCHLVPWQHPLKNKVMKPSNGVYILKTAIAFLPSRAKRQTVSHPSGVLPAIAVWLCKSKHWWQKQLRVGPVEAMSAPKPWDRHCGRPLMETYSQLSSSTSVCAWLEVPCFLPGRWRLCRGEVGTETIKRARPHFSEKCRRGEGVLHRQPGQACLSSVSHNTH